MKIDRPIGWIRRTELALSAAQFLLAGLAAGLDFSGTCGACSRGESLHLAIAVSGVLGYGALLALGLAGKRKIFTRGVFAAAGIHGALGALLVLGGRLCLVCLGSCALAIVLPAITCRRAKSTISALLGSAAPASLLAFALTIPGWAEVGTRRDRPALPSAPVAEIRAASVPFPAQLDVYETSHCTYCASFRSDYLPRLESEFQERLEIRFHDAREAPWVERTPTFVLNGRLLFEGLPYRYQDLLQAIRAQSMMENVR